MHHSWVLFLMMASVVPCFWKMSAPRNDGGYIFGTSITLV